MGANYTETENLLTQIFNLFSNRRFSVCAVVARSAPLCIRLNVIAVIRWTLLGPEQLQPTKLIYYANFLLLLLRRSVKSARRKGKA